MCSLEYCLFPKEQFKILLSSMPSTDISIVVCLNEDKEDSADEDKLDKWDYLCIDAGFEFISCSLDGLEKSESIGRIQEALQAYPWPESSHSNTSVSPSNTDLTSESLERKNLSLSFDDEFTPFVSGEDSEFSPTESEIEALGRQLFGPSTGVNTSSDMKDPEEEMDNDISDMANRLLSLKEQSENLPDAERRRFAELVALAFAAHLDES